MFNFWGLNNCFPVSLSRSRLQASLQDLRQMWSLQTPTIWRRSKLPAPAKCNASGFHKETRPTKAMLAKRHVPIWLLTSPVCEISLPCRINLIKICSLSGQFLDMIDEGLPAGRILFSNTSVLEAACAYLVSQLARVCALSRRSPLH